MAVAARFDKYDPMSGGFRAPLGAAVITADIGIPVGVGISSSGTVEVGASDSGVLGVICPDKIMNVGDTIDVMTAGEIVESGAGTLGAAGAVLFAAADDGAIDATTTGTRVGHLVQAWRLVVRVQPIPSDYFGS
jgi:hypothetical protein